MKLFPAPCPLAREAVPSPTLLSLFGWLQRLCCTVDLFVWNEWPFKGTIQRLTETTVLPEKVHCLSWFDCFHLNCMCGIFMVLFIVYLTIACT